MAKSDVQVSDLVAWQFTLYKRGQSSRYGKLGGLFYKQYLPFGRADDRIYPARSISPSQYRLALREYDRVKGQTPGIK